MVKIFLKNLIFQESLHYFHKIWAFGPKSLHFPSFDPLILCPGLSNHGLRYRCGDALRSLTKTVIKEARLKELKNEILNSKNLKEYFEDNPRDLQLLRHDKILSKRTTKMVTIPDYLVPDSLRTYLGTSAKKRKHQSSGKEFKKKLFLNKKKKVEHKRAKKGSDPLNF